MSAERLLKVPELSLVALVGISGSGKSTFAKAHFRPTEVLSSDYFRGLVSDDENDQSVSAEAFDALYYVAARRLALGRLTVVDATNVQAEDRKKLILLAREHHVLPVAIVLDLPRRTCETHNEGRSERNFGPHVLRQQHAALRRSLRNLRREGFRQVYLLDSQEAVDAARVERTRMWNDRRDEHGPFDIVGDLHGCCDELEALLDGLGYKAEPVGGGSPTYRHPQGRRVVFLGDIVDRGPRILDALDLVMAMVQQGQALCMPGNHDMKLLKKLNGRAVQITHGLAETLEELDRIPESERAARVERYIEFLDGLVSHYVLDDGRLVVAHAGMKQAYQGRGSGVVRDFALYGETTGETDEYGLPVRHDWAAEYRGPAVVAYGHTPVPEAEWLNNTINVDTGCVFGGRLTALRYPERELYSVPAARTYCEPKKPFLAEDLQAPRLAAQHIYDDVLDFADVSGRRAIDTALHQRVTVREPQATAALEAITRFAAHPKWLIYLPPTMSPCGTSQEPGLLEHPREALDYFLHEGVAQAVCEEKHMGSRAVLVICRNESVAERRFGVAGEGRGIIYTRTGRHFFDDQEMEQAVLARMAQALELAGLWDAWETDWVCLDAELLPWSAKAQALLKGQYAPVGAAARAALAEAVRTLEIGAVRQAELGSLLDRFRERQVMAGRYVEAYRQYCWPVAGIDDLKLAPFHVLATEGRVHADQTHVWHMEGLARLCAADPAWLLATPYRVVDLTNADSTKAAIAWWERLTGQGGEGMVVKPLDFVSRGRKGLIQPAVKCRGPEYLRIIYSPEYTAERHLERLRHRGLAHKRSLALREFALGIEGLQRFVRREPLRRVHECVFGVLALESDPVDPRL